MTFNSPFIFIMPVVNVINFTRPVQGSFHFTRDHYHKVKQLYTIRLARRLSSGLIGQFKSFNGIATKVTRQ